MNSQNAFQFTKQPFYQDDDIRQIGSVNFSMFSALEISKIAEVQVSKGVYYDKNKLPIADGLLDLKMGPAHKSAGICATCHAKFDDCQGHYGYVPLALPVFNIGYIGAIRDILKSICKSCSRILLPEKDFQDYLKKMRRLDTLHKIALRKKILDRFSNKKQVECFRCGYINGKVTKGASQLAIVHCLPKRAIAEDEGESSKSSIIYPLDALLLFNQMLDQDCELLCIADRPEKLIFTNILVPPVSIRPSIFVDGGTISNENDITERLKRIIQANASLRQKTEGTCNSLRILDDWDYLQVEVAQYINSDIHGASQFQQPLKALSGFVQRLKGKLGRFRGHLSGKRVEFTGRTVISPDPNLKITEVGVPLLMATILTYPELVNHQNIEKLRQCVLNGSKKYPGAKFVVEANGDKRDLSFGNRKRIADGLKFGSKVHRYLEDGDVLLFNRQPSLHRMSIMCHRARIMPWRTLRFNESVCNPYNADFDGDEMNIHVPQTEEARAEALMLMGVQNNLCTPKNGALLVASTQDFLTSSFLITRKDIFYDRATFSLVCSYMGDGTDMIDLPTPALIKPIELWTGKQVFNVLLRPNAQMKVFVNCIVKEKIYSRIEHRKMSREETMCPNDGFVYFRNSELISGQLGKATLGNGNKVGLFSVLVRDYNAYAAAACMDRLAKFSSRWIGNHGFSIGIDDVQPGNKLLKKKEGIISNGKCDELIQFFKEGKLPLMPGFDAAQTLEARITEELNKMREEAGRECMKALHWRNSPLIMSQCGSKGSPINISQMVACVGQQAVGGRRAPDGFIDCSLPHFQRKSVSPKAKGFVENSFYSGLTATEFFFHTMGGREGLVDTAVKTATTGYMSRRLIKCLEDLSVEYDMTVRNSSGCVIQFIYGDDGMDPAQMEGTEGFPLDFERLLLKVEATCQAGRTQNLSPSEISEIINKRLSKDDVTYYGAGSDAFKKKLLEFFEKIGQRRCCVSSKQLQVFLDACIFRLHSKGVEAGIGIGAIGAQSIGEPGTQMTLKTFHFAGVASMNVTLGVPRINEIINASKRISTPIIMAKLEDDQSMEIAQIVRGQIEKTLLGQVAKSIRLVMESFKASIVIKLDMEKITSSRLFINARVVGEKILKSPKLLKDYKMNILVVNDSRLAVSLEDKVNDNKNNYHFALHQLKNKLPKIIVKGMSTVERAIIADDRGKLKKLNLIVEGTGLREVMGVHGIEGSETESNHVIEVQQTLGIEAARSCIIKEIRKVMQSHSMDVDTRHMMLLADVMTSKGEILGVNRYGIAQMKESVLTLASFEKTDYHLFNGSLHGRKDEIKGVGERIIMGTPTKIGTGIIKIKQRVDPLPILRYGPDLIMSSLVK